MACRKAASEAEQHDAERESLRHLCDELRRELSLQSERLALMAPIVAERNSVAAERDSLAAARDSLAAERDSLVAERDVLAASNRDLAACVAALQQSAADSSDRERVLAFAMTERVALERLLDEARLAICAPRGEGRTTAPAAKGVQNEQVSSERQEQCQQQQQLLQDLLAEWVQLMSSPGLPLVSDPTIEMQTGAATVCACAACQFACFYSSRCSVLHFARLMEPFLVGWCAAASRPCVCLWG